jgi:hypothetical protein
LKHGIEKQSKAAGAQLKACAVPIFELQEQWALQQASQLSVRARM